MKYFIYFLAIFLCSCYNQTKDNYKEYKFNAIRWSLKVPKQFILVDLKTINQQNKEGKKLVQDAYDSNIDIKDPNTLISFKYRNNTFICNILPFDTIKNGSWSEHAAFLGETIFQTIHTSTQGLEKKTIDTSSETVLIDKQIFNKFLLVINKPDQTITLEQFSILRNGYDFGIAIVCEDETVRQQFNNILKESKFY